MRTAGLGLLLVALATSQAHAYCLTTVTGATSPYVSWGWSPVDYRVSSNLTDPQLLAAIDAAFGTWSGVSCSTLKLKKTTSFTPCFQAPCAPSAVEFTQSTGTINVFWYSSATGFPTGSQYVAYMYFVHDGQGKILSGSIAINAFNYKWNGSGGSIPLLILDLQNEMTAFIGQVIGISGSNVPTATMAPGIGYGDTSKRVLDPDDVNAVVQLYKVSTCAAPPPPGANGCSVPPVAVDAGVPDAAPVQDQLGLVDLAPVDSPMGLDAAATDQVLAVEAGADLTAHDGAGHDGAGHDSVGHDGTGPDAGASDGKPPTDAMKTDQDVSGDTSPSDGADKDSGPLYAPQDDGCCRVGHARDVTPGNMLLLLMGIGLVLWRRRRPPPST